MYCPLFKNSFATLISTRPMKLKQLFIKLHFLGPANYTFHLSLLPRCAAQLQQGLESRERQSRGQWQPTALLLLPLTYSTGSLKVTPTDNLAKYALQTIMQCTYLHMPLLCHKGLYCILHLI